DRRRRVPATRPTEHLTPAPARQVRVLLGPRQRELLRDDALREHEPGMVVARLTQMRESAERIEPGEERGGQTIAACVEPDGRWPRKNPNPVAAPGPGPSCHALPRVA